MVLDAAGTCKTFALLQCLWFLASLERGGLLRDFGWNGTWIFAEVGRLGAERWEGQHWRRCLRARVAQPVQQPGFWNFAEHAHTAGINRSNTAVQAVLKQPCSTGGRTGTVRPKQEPTGRTDLSDRSRLVLCDRSQELIGQACLTQRQVLWSDSACPTTG
ncbi:hypothetical protein PCANC_17043 [Puccinia coronata f. sp. avenae]|uniref:Uncharacterized protein n=1 Tax=Puccinia coronata f. sp. avenae TaxID=200324 RepID=A0A2N5SNZ7_9BASI|nr:hypothetical protein PCANC_17043 [Puccinia coronata f. sp. avenae]